MNIVEVIWYIFQFLTGYNLVLPVLLFLIWKITKKRAHPGLHWPLTRIDYGIIITAYEQTDSIPPLVDSLLKQNHQNFIIYIVADKCDVSNLHFNSDQVVILRPPQVLASNIRSHFYAIKHFKRPHTHLTILDSDNLALPFYLQSLNYYFEQGYHAVQGVRRAKNYDSVYACLDAARDIYYRFYDSKILFELGSSSTLAGSGMAFSTGFYIICLKHHTASGAGFDKILQYELVRRGHQIAFSDSALVLDEKTSRPDQLVNQRARWINTWFRYFHYGFSLMSKGISRFNRNQFLFGLTLLRPPLFIFLILSVLCMLVNLWISPIMSVVWLAGLLIFVTGFYLALYRSDTPAKVWESLGAIPKFMYLQVVSLLKARKANERSVATRHYHSSSVEDTLNKRNEN